MKDEDSMRRALGNGTAAVAATLVLLALGLAGPACEVAREAKDDFDSHIACQDYCAKAYACKNHTPTTDETSSCVSACRNSIENNCGNDHQAAANDKIGECVDKGCVDFWGCMVFQAAPECYGFVSQ